jgi:hypothetical protein
MIDRNPTKSSQFPLGAARVIGRAQREKAATFAEVVVGHVERRSRPRTANAILLRNLRRRFGKMRVCGQKTSFAGKTDPSLPKIVSRTSMKEVGMWSFSSAK